MLQLSKKGVLAVAAAVVLLLAIGEPAAARRLNREPYDSGIVDQDFGDGYGAPPAAAPGYVRPDEESSIGEVGAGLGPFTTEEDLGPDF